MAATISYTGNGQLTQFTFPFEYLDETDIKVSLDGVETTAYSLANATTVEFNTAPATGVAIRIFRVTNSDSLKATFFAGSAIRAQDLNNNFNQALYVTQEVVERYIDNTDATFANDVDLNGFKILNLEDGTADSDAVNKGQLDAAQTYNDQQLASTLSDAQAASTAAQTAETNAETAQAAAEQAQADAEDAIADIQALADAAADSAQDAQDAATQAATFTSDPIFYGFSRSNTSELVSTWSTATEPNVVYNPTDYEYKDQKHWFIGTNGLLATTGANIGEPNFSFNANGHLIIDLD